MEDHPNLQEQAHEDGKAYEEGCARRHSQNIRNQMTKQQSTWRIEWRRNHKQEQCNREFEYRRSGIEGPWKPVIGAASSAAL